MGITVIILCLFNLRKLDNPYVDNFWNNSTLISNFILFLAPLIIIILIIFLVLFKKVVIRVEKMSIGGFNILFDNPNQLFKRQMKNFLDTKRTLFKIDENHDNFSEAFDSYFEVYKFIRDEIKVLGNVKDKAAKRKNETLELYLLANQMIKKLNNFLTKYQNDFRRWYKYEEKHYENEFYLLPIGELQNKYQKNKDLIKGFKEINVFFSNGIAKKLDIDIDKWGDPDA